MTLLPLLLLPVLLAVLLIHGVIEVSAWIADKISDYRANKRARIEAELDRQQAELHAVILSLASQLGSEAHEARKALIRESYLASQAESQRPR